MSLKVMVWAFHEAPRDLRPAEMVLLLALADAANDHGEVMYLEDDTQEGIAHKTRLSRRTVQRTMDSLATRGIVVREQESMVDPYRYRIAMRQNDASTGRQVDAKQGVRMTHRTSIDSSNSGAHSRKPKKGQKHPLPADWVPTAEHRSKALERGVDVESEAESFRLHAEANAREAVVWNAAFSQWLLKARPSAAPAGSDGQMFAPADAWMEFSR